MVVVLSLILVVWGVRTEVAAVEKSCTLGVIDRLATVCLIFVVTYTLSSVFAFVGRSSVEDSPAAVSTFEVVERSQAVDCTFAVVEGSPAID